MQLIDFHAHVLPGIDDGASNIEEARAILLSQKAQGIQTVVATPHYSKHSSITKFTEERDAALRLVEQEIQDEIPRIVPAAEVELYYGLSKRRNLQRLCIQGTNYILVEPPMEYWNSWVYEEIYALSIQHGLRPIIAHLDRYVLDKKNSKHIEKILKMEVLIQINAGALFSFFGRRTVKNFWKHDAITVLGSDCHDMAERKCELQKACLFFQKMFGEKALRSIIENSNKILENEPVFRMIED